MFCSSVPRQWSALLIFCLIAGGLAPAAADDGRYRPHAGPRSRSESAERSTAGESGSDAVRTAAIHKIPSEHPLMPAIKLARTSLAAMESIADYEATLLKQERLNGELSTQRLKLRLRESPFSVYLSLEDESAGREMLYVQGKYNNQLQARVGSGLKSLVGTVSLATDGVEAMQGNRYPITMIGMRRMLQNVLAQWEEEAQYAEVEVEFYPNARLGERSCQVIQVTHPQARRQFPFHMTRLFIDSESRLPVRVEKYGFPRMPGRQPPLEELYSYSQIRTNIGLSDRDFSTKNPDYNF